MVRSISLLVESPLSVLAQAMRQVPTETKKFIGSETKKAAQPIWFDELKGRALSRVQQRVLVDSARVSVTARNVTLKSGAVGKLRSGTPVIALSSAAEFGMSPAKEITQRSKKGKTYTRKAGPTFGAPRRSGNVVYPAANDSIPRFASLWIQTAHRALFDAAEKG